MGVEGEYYEGPCKLLELPHYVLATLFSYVDSTSLYHLSQTCNYLKDFIDDPSFWRYIDARDEPNTCNKLNYCTNRVHGRTTHLLLQGNLNLFDLPLNFFEKIKPFQNLRVLALENLKLQGSKVALKDFPSGLEELSLRRTYVKNSTYFFQHSFRNMSKLRVLILDECCWVTCSFLLSVSKYEHLEIISIVKCLRVHLTMVPYLNVAKFGCKKLKVFDCRFTGIGGELLRTFYSKESLQRLYFQSFKSAEVDYNEKIIDYSGMGSLKNPPPDPNTPISIADIDLREYASTYAKPADEVEKVFDSLLYQDPYPECCCGSMESKEDKLFSDTEMEFFDDDMVHIPCGRGEPKFVCNKHMKNILNLPSSLKDFFLSQQRQFHPASEEHFETDSNSDDEEDGACCYFGIGSSMIIPSTHDRTPSRREEMTLPREGARNQTPTRVFIYNPSRRDDGTSEDRNSDSSNNSSPRCIITPRNCSPKQSSSNSTTKRKHVQSDSDSDSDTGQNKRSRRRESSDQDGLSSRAHAMLFNQLVESADEVSSRIERIMEENGMAPPNHRRLSSDDEDGPHHVILKVTPEKKDLPVTGSPRTRNELQENLLSYKNGSNIQGTSYSTFTTNSRQTRTEFPMNADSGPSCSKTEANTTQISKLGHSKKPSTDISNSSTHTRTENMNSTEEPTSSMNSDFDFSENNSVFLETSTSSTQTMRRDSFSMHEGDNGPSCSHENIFCSENDDSPHQSENDQESLSTDSDTSSLDGNSSRRKKCPPASNSKKSNQRQSVQRVHPGPSQRVDPPYVNVILHHHDRGRQKKKIPLRRLSLRGYRRVTDLTLSYIANLEIELIDLTCTSVTKQGIENFLVHNPNCRVIHPLYCTCKPKNPL